VTNLGYSTFYAKGWHQDYDSFELLVDKDYFDNCLNPGQQAALRDATRDNMLASREVDIAKQCKAIKDIRTILMDADGSFHNSTWPRKLLGALKDDAYAFFAAQATPGSDFKRVWDSLNAFKPYVPHDIPHPDSCEVAGQ